MGKKIYTALGLMSGTSLDGVDAAFLKTDGTQIIEFGPSLTLKYRPDEAEVLTNATQAALEWRFKGPPPNIFAQAANISEQAHVRASRQLMYENPDWASSLDIIGYHGQTVLHHPPIKGRSGQTCQIGRGYALAKAFGVPCVFDFRSADVAAGGQGAPLAPIYHQALCDFSGLEGRTAIVNIGGVSNATFVEQSTPLQATDCGPGNGPLDSWVARKAGRDYDLDGALSRQGDVYFNYIYQWLDRDFFTRSLPRSADRYDFDVLDEISALNLADGAATLAAFAAEAIWRDLRDFEPDHILICGGGRRNTAIMDMLRALSSMSVKNCDDIGWDGDALEAEAFAFLAVRSALGLPLSFPGTTGVSKPMSGGVTAHP